MRLGLCLCLSLCLCFGGGCGFGFILCDTLTENSHSERLIRYINARGLGAIDHVGNAYSALLKYLGELIGKLGCVIFKLKHCGSLQKLTALYGPLYQLAPFGDILPTHSYSILIRIAVNEEAVFLLSHLMGNVLAYLEEYIISRNVIANAVSNGGIEPRPLNPEVSRCAALRADKQAAVGNVLGGMLHIA